MKIKREFVSTVYIIENNKVLLNMNKKLKKFVPVGGHLEKNELPCESAIREAKEETGFDIELIHPRKYGRKELIQNLDIGLDIIKPNHHHINLAYIGKIIGGKQLKKADDGTELRWFSKQELVECKNTFPNVKGAALRALHIINNN